MFASLPFRLIIDILSNEFMAFELPFVYDMSIRDRFGYFKLDKSRKIFMLCSVFKACDRDFYEDDYYSELQRKSQFDKLRIMDFKECSFLGKVFPNCLRVLRVNLCDTFTGESLPKNLKILDVKSCKLFVGENLPKSLFYLRVHYCKLFIGKNLSENLREVKVGCCKNCNFEKFPKSIKTIEIEGSYFYQKQFPDKLKKLSLHGLGIFDGFENGRGFLNLNFLPREKCEKLQLTKFSSMIGQFPKNIKTLSLTEVVFCGSLPEKIENLQLKNLSRFGVTKFPKTLKQIRVFNCNFCEIFKNYYNLEETSIKVIKVFDSKKFRGNILPAGIKELCVWNCYNFEGNGISLSSIEKLEVVRCYKFFERFFPRNIKDLKLCYNGWRENDPIFEKNSQKGMMERLHLKKINFNENNLPQTLKKLSVEECSNFYGKKLPEFLQKLKVTDCFNFNPKTLPKNLKKLKVRNCASFSGENLPKSLETLIISRCKDF